MKQGSPGALTQVLSGGGGMGKTQLAAACAHQANAVGVDVLVWVNAAETAQVMAAYATAARLVKAAGTHEQDLEADARAFLAWLSVTEHTWLVVLDDLSDLEGADAWWPRPGYGGSGRVLATTRRRDALVTGGGRAIVEVDTYSPEEALAYLRERFTSAHTRHLLDASAGALVRELGCLPLALGHAAAYMINEDEACTDYLRRFTSQVSDLDALLPPGADTEGYGRQVTASLLLALNTLQHREPVGLAIPAIRLAARLDSAGHPHDVWITAAVIEYLTAHRTPASDNPPPIEVTLEQAHAALRQLHHYALITIDAHEGPRAVRLHALTARATRETTPAGDVLATVTAAADALVTIWPSNDQASPDLAGALRANTDFLATGSGDLLWQGHGHQVLFRAGSSLLDAKTHTTAMAYWHRLAADALRLLGGEHPDTLIARGSLASSYRQAGRLTEAIMAEEQLVADCARLLGDGDPVTLTARGNLASTYLEAGRITMANTLSEQVVADSKLLLGDRHPETLRAQGNLAVSYKRAGRAAEAIAVQEQVLAHRSQLLGDEDPGTLTARGNLASSFWEVGRLSDAIALQKRVVHDSERLLGDKHPDTLTARGNLAASYYQAGRTDDAITLLEQVVADRKLLQGDKHPHTLLARGNLASIYGQAGRTAEAISLLKQVVADSGLDGHSDMLRLRGNIAGFYWQAGHTGEAITLLSQVFADCKRLLGVSHIETRTAATVLRTWRRTRK